MNINIAIDGPSAAGKSSIADLLAAELGYIHLDTGAMYRAVGLYCLRNKIDFNDGELIAERMKEMKLEVFADGRIFLNGENVSDTIRENEVSMAASQVSKHAGVRRMLVAMQQDIVKEKGYIVDGRDIGTVVLKDAELKIYLTASVESRALRRMLQNQEQGIEADLEAIKKDIEQRDYQDMHREVSPLIKADDAIEIDSSDLSIEEVLELILSLVRKVQA